MITLALAAAANVPHTAVLAYSGGHHIGAGIIVLIVVLAAIAFCLVVGLGVWRSRRGR